MPPGLDEAALNPQVDPCDDFYQYACGGWIARTEIPPDRARYGRGFVAIDERNEQLLKDILERTAKGQAPPAAKFAKQLGDYWSTCIDEAALEKALPAFQAKAKDIDTVKDAASLSKLVGRWHSQGIWPFFDIDSIQDFNDASLYVFNIDQSGIGLPDRDYYVKDDDAKMKAVREAYAAHVIKMFQLLGQTPEQAKTSSDQVMALETQLARASLDNVQRRDPKALNHRLERKGVASTAPAFSWDLYFQALGFPSAQKINVTVPAFLQEVNAVVTSKQLEQWRTYLRWTLLRSSVPALPRVFQDQHFKFQSANFTGAKEERARWKKCVDFTTGDLEQALGQAYVAVAFPPEAKQTTQKMVKVIEQIFAKNLGTLEWMDEPTKAEALTKVRKIVNKIGYPDKWRDYSGLKTTRESFLANSLAANAFEMKRRLSRVGKPVDKSEWHMPPQMVNAYYDPSANEIVFLAGILQPPFFDPKASPAVNLAATGMVVGHEITHGFDDEGRQFDAKGNLRDWWSPKSASAFTERAECVKKQYDQYIAVDDLKLNGALTLGENVADLGGIKLAFGALPGWLAEHPAPTDTRYTPEQQFFLGFAQSWCSKSRPEQARMRVTTDPHSTPEHRVNGPLRNFPAFQETFGCVAGDPMIQVRRCEVW
jgi:putative endopeptidase